MTRDLSFAYQGVVVASCLRKFGIRRRRFVEQHGCAPSTARARRNPAYADQRRVRSTASSKRWRSRNGELARIRAQKATAAWRRRNPEKVASSNVFRNRRYWRAFRNLTPQEQTRLVAIYKVRDKINGTTNISAGERIAEVDHLLPLVQGGAHHPDNLLVMTTAANRFWGGRVKACPWPQPADWTEPAWEITAADTNPHT